MNQKKLALAYKNGAIKAFFDHETESRLRVDYTEKQEKEILRNMLTDGDAVERYLARLKEIRGAVRKEMEESIGAELFVDEGGPRTETGVLHRMSAVESATAIAFVTMAEKGEIDGITAVEHSDLFSPWAENVSYAEGSIRTYEGMLYRCLQPHISQSDWTPDAASSLWTAVSDPGQEYPLWSQPVGAHDAYAKGDVVMHSGVKWISTADGNVWEPGVYGWERATSQTTLQ